MLPPFPGIRLYPPYPAENATFTEEEVLLILKSGGSVADDKKSGFAPTLDVCMRCNKFITDHYTYSKYLLDEASQNEALRQRKAKMVKRVQESFTQSLK